MAMFCLALRSKGYQRVPFLLKTTIELHYMLKNGCITRVFTMHNKSPRIDLRLFSIYLININMTRPSAPKECVFFIKNAPLLKMFYKSKIC